jgi:thioredoxin-like negative regulator of GroEL
VDADLPENEELLRDYDIRSIPTLVLLNADGEILSAITGTHTEFQLIEWIDSEIGKKELVEEIKQESIID